MWTRKLAALGALLLVMGAACGDDDNGSEEEDAAEGDETEAEGDPASGVTTDELPEGVVPACDVSEEAVVADTFGGTEATKELQMDACTYQVTDGLVESVALLHPSPASDEWLSWRTMIEQWGDQAETGVSQELTDLEDVGDEGYMVVYEDMAEMLLMVRTETTMFRVGTSGSTSPEAATALEEFGRHVVDYLETQEAPSGGE